MDSLPIAPPVGGGSPQKRTVCPQGTLRLRCCSSECAVAPLEIGVQAIQLSPYHAGLAGRHLQHLPVAPAFLACCFPLRLSPSGEPDDPGTFLRVPPVCVRDSVPRSAAHTFAAHGSPVVDVQSAGSWVGRVRVGLPAGMAVWQFLPLSRMMARVISASRMSRTSTPRPSNHLPPFAMWPALPTPDYYGGSVAMGLAPDRRS
jgi:hypothetical protein